MKHPLTGLVLILLAACGDGTSGKAPVGPTPDSGGASSSAAAADLPKGTHTYYFGSSESRSNVSFTSETKVTKIMGTTNIVNGSATVDFDAKTGTCHLVVPVAGLRTGMEDRDRAMWNPTWLDEAKHKTIEFKGEKATFSAPNRWKIEGKFTMKGVTKDMTVDAVVVPIPEALTKKMNFGDGAWARVRTTFNVAIKDYGIQPDASAVATVQDVWPVEFDVYGTTAKPSKELVALKHDDNAAPVPIPRKKVSKDGLPGKIYEFGKKPQLATFDARSETVLEKVTAQTNIVTGWLGLDAEKGEAKVRLAIPVKSLKTGIQNRDDQLRSATWLDADKYPFIEYESTKATKKDDQTWAVEGTLTIHGVSKPVAVEVKVNEIPAEEVKKARWGDKPGLGCRTSFKIKLSDFGVGIPDVSKGKVNDEWAIGIDLKGLLSE